MDKNILKIKRWRKTHSKLLKFIESSETVSGDKIREWIADCIVYFTEINVGPNIIDFFLRSLEHRKNIIEKKKTGIILTRDMYGNLPQEKIEYERSIGPFPYVVGGYVINNKNMLSGKKADSTQMTSILVAFKVAENIIDNYEEEERIIPKTLINEFNTEKTQGIYLALGSVQNSYEKKSAKNILAGLITTTSLICELIPEVATIKDVGPKIKKIYETDTIYKKYNLNREVLWSVNNSRIIRNHDIHTPKKENHTTLHEAVGYSHMLVLLISALLASGEVKLK